ncbi:MAG: hypothetical protein ACFN21_03265 [Candidatus Saccharibacteria bacterium]
MKSNRQCRQSDTFPSRKHPFQLENKKIGGGNFKKIIFWWNDQALGLSLHDSVFTLEIGSSFGVYCHHFGTKLETVALLGGFF